MTMYFGPFVPEFARTVLHRASFSLFFTFVHQPCTHRLPLYDKEYLSKQPKAYRDLEILPSEITTIGYCKLSLSLLRQFVVTYNRGLARKLVGSNKYAKRFKEEFTALQTEAERDEWISRKMKEHQDIKEVSELGLARLTSQLLNGETSSMLACVKDGINP